MGNIKTCVCTYVGITVLMSMGLNSLANSQHAPASMQWASCSIGAVIPVLVLLLGRIAGLTHKAGQLRLSYMVGGIGVAVLLLSVHHCQMSIQLLTGSNWMLSTMLAVGIDCGLVACEIVSVVGDAPPKRTVARRRTVRQPKTKLHAIA